LWHLRRRARRLSFPPRGGESGMRVRLMILLAVAACAVGLTALATSSSASGTKPPVTVAILTFDVPGSSLLPEFQTGANAAAKVINAAGGFGGRKLVFVSFNTSLSPATATVCAHQTIAKHPVASIGCELF